MDSTKRRQAAHLNLDETRKEYGVAKRSKSKFQ